MGAVESSDNVMMNEKEPRRGTHAAKAQQCVQAMTNTWSGATMEYNNANVYVKMMIERGIRQVFRKKAPSIH